MFAPQPPADISTCPVPEYHKDGGVTCAVGDASALRPLQARWRVNGAWLVLKSRGDYAGAISSLSYGGREYLDGTEHGYLLQGAVQYDGGAECLNPTQAGSRTDPPGRSSSRLLQAEMGPAIYRTTTQMAYWTPPGRSCTDAAGRRSLSWNDRVLSDAIYSQRLTPNYRGRWNAILDHVTLVTGRRHRQVGFEAVTGYMPTSFDTFYDFDPDTHRLKPDADLLAHSAERPEPLVVATRDGRQAMAVLSLQDGATAYYAGFHNLKVSKWSLVFHWPEGLAPGRHVVDSVIIIGARDQVAATLAALYTSDAADLPILIGLGLTSLAALICAYLIIAQRRRRARRPLTPIGLKEVEET